MRSLASQEDEARATEDERARDVNKDRDIVVLAAIFRSVNAAHVSTHYRGDNRQAFGQMLRYVSHLMQDGWGAADAHFPQQVFDDHGPSAVLVALKQAYDHPDPIVSDVVEFP